MKLFSTIRSLATSSRIRETVGVAMTATAVGGFLLVRPDCMMVEHIVFDGAHHAGPGALRHLAELQNGTTLWSADLEDVATGVERHPWVRSARVSRQWPDTLVVQVEERVPVAVLHYDDIYYVDAEGVPFLRGELPSYDFPNLTGIDPGMERRHPSLPNLVVRDALALIQALDGRGLAHVDTISEVSFSQTRGFTVHVEQSRVLFGLSDTDKQLDRLAMLVSRGQVELSNRLWVDLGPSTVAIVRPLDRPIGS